MNLLEIFAKLGLDSSEYDEKIQKAAWTAKSIGAKIGGGLATAAKVGGAAIAAVGAATVAATSALLKGAQETAAIGDNIDKMSQKMGLSAEAYQEWDAVMQHAGASIESLRAGMRTLSNAAVSGNKAFAALGISEEKVANLSKEDLFAEVITGLQNVEDEQQRTYLAGQLLGRGAVELGALMNMSAEETEEMRKRVHELGGVMSDEAVKASATFADNLQDLKTALGGIKKQITAEFLPGLNTLMSGFTKLLINEDGATEELEKGFDLLIGSFSKTVDRVADIAGNLIPSIVSAVTANIPQLLSAAMGLVQTAAEVLVSAAPDIIQTVVDFLADLMSGDTLSKMINVVITLINGISKIIPTLIPQIVQMVLELISAITNPETLASIIQTGITLFMALLTGIKDALPAILEALPTIIENFVNALVEALPMLIEFGLELVETLFDAIVSNLDLILDAAIRIIFAIVDGLVSMLPELLPVVFKLIMTLTSAMIEHLPEIIDAGIQLVEALIEGILGYIENLIGAGMTLVANLFDAIVQAAADLIDAGKQLVEKVKDGFLQKVEDAKQWGKDLISGFINGILEKWENLKSKVTGVVDKIKGIFTGAKGLDTHSPSKWAEKVFKNVMEGAEIGVDTGKRSLFDTTDDMVADLQNRFNNSMTVTAGASDGSVYALLAQYLPQLASQKVVLDSGTLVGELTPGIDTALGQRAAFAQRRAAT